MTNTHCKITDLDSEVSYIASGEERCRDEVDCSAYLSCIESGKLVMMGMVVAQPATAEEKAEDENEEAESEAAWDVFFDCDPVKDKSDSQVDCDPRLDDAPYTREELAELNKQHRVWTMVSGDDDRSHIALGWHYVNALAFHVTEKPAPESLWEA